MQSGEKPREWVAVKIKNAVLAGVLALAFGNAQALESYTFSETLQGGTKITGSFQGDASGNLISNISNISVAFDGDAFNGSGHLFSAAISVGIGWVSGAVVSFDGTQNNFAFVDSDIANGNFWLTNYFWSFTSLPEINSLDRACNRNDICVDGPAQSWSVTTVNPVPEPETYAMMLAGLGLLGFKARSRKSS